MGMVALLVHGHPDAHIRDEGGDAAGDDDGDYGERHVSILLGWVCFVGGPTGFGFMQPSDLFIGLFSGRVVLPLAETLFLLQLLQTFLQPLLSFFLRFFSSIARFTLSARR